MILMLRVLRALFGLAGMIFLEASLKPAIEFLSGQGDAGLAAAWRIGVGLIAMSLFVASRKYVNFIASRKGYPPNQPLSSVFTL